MAPILPERFWSKVEVDPVLGHWLWKANKTKKGYGHYKVNGKYVYAHRYAYEFLVGPIPAGLVTDHLCYERSCVNPEHLEMVTNKVNLLRGDTLAARNAAKTHCPRGHEYSQENTRLEVKRTRVHRRCRACGG